MLMSFVLCIRQCMFIMLFTHQLQSEGTDSEMKMVLTQSKLSLLIDLTLHINSYFGQGQCYVRLQVSHTDSDEAREGSISVDPESIPVCGDNLVSGPLAEIRDRKVELGSRLKSHYQIGPAQHFSPK